MYLELNKGETELVNTILLQNFEVNNKEMGSLYNFYPNSLISCSP